MKQTYYQNISHKSPENIGTTVTIAGRKAIVEQVLNNGDCILVGVRYEDTRKKRKSGYEFCKRTFARLDEVTFSDDISNRIINA